MRFTRNAKILRTQLDVAPFACVFVLLLMFTLLQPNFVFTTGVRIELPATDALPGTLNPTLVVAVDHAGQLYFANQVVTEADLQTQLTAASARYRAIRQDLTLVVQADKTVPHERLVRLAEVARAAGIREVLQATRPSLHAPRNGP
ncbi:MAG: hypothetical protein FJ386_07890 [Verrucomicrobia bacterium]|nr:hypothetical protein [Verrucomicrobiota bacterium]